MQPKGCENGLRLSNLNKFDCVRLAPSLHAETLNNEMMEAMDFKKYSDEEFKEALVATLNLKKEWMASVTRREKELGIQ